MPGRGMSFVLYAVVLVVSVASVMMGLDWLSTPPPPLPKSVQTVSAPAKPAAPAASKKIATREPRNQANRTEPRCVRADRWLDRQGDLTRRRQRR